MISVSKSKTLITYLMRAYSDDNNQSCNTVILILFKEYAVLIIHNHHRCISSIQLS